MRVCLRAVGFAYDKTLELAPEADGKVEWWSSRSSVGCYSGGRYGERPQWVERDGRRAGGRRASIDSTARKTVWSST